MSVDNEKPEEVAVIEGEEVIKHIDVKKTSKLLRVVLNQEELLKAGADLAETQQELDEANEELKTIKADFKMRTTGIEARAAKLGALVRQKYDMREVDIEITMDFDAGTITVLRLDDGTVCEERPMNSEEKQRKLKIFPEKSEATDADGKLVEPDLGVIEIHDAIKVLVETKRASTAMIQRKMGIKPQRAWLILDKLEEFKVVGRMEDGEIREILMDEVTLQRFLEEFPERMEEHEVDAILATLKNVKPEETEEVEATEDEFGGESLPEE